MAPISGFDNNMARDLLKLTKRGRALIDLPVQKGRQLIRQIPEPIQIGIGKLSRRSLSLTLEIFAGLFVIALVMVALAYGRLNQGPLSLSGLVPILEDAINRELVHADLRIRIDDAVLKREKIGPGVNFRLRNIRLIDNQGAVVAQAPLAAIGLSGRALLRGRIAPGSVDFIGPRLLLFHSKEGGLSLSFSRGAASGQPADALRGSVGDNQSAAPGKPVIGSSRNINLFPTIAAAFDQARKRKTASAYLSRFGVRDAVVIFEQSGKRSIWQVPDFAIDLEHKKKTSTILGEGSISSASGPWTFNFRAEQSAKRNQLTFTALIENLILADLAANFPDIPALETIRMPLSATTSIHLSTSGELQSVEARLNLGAGHIIIPWDLKRVLQMDSVSLNLRYEAKDGRIDILPSKVEWGQSRATISGTFHPVKGQVEGKIWAFNLKADDAILAVEEYGLPPVRVQNWSARGTFDKQAGRLVLEQFIIQLEDGSIEFSGTVTDAPGSPEIRLAGKFSSMPLESLIQLWPKFLAGGAREWVGEHVSAGHISGGSFRVDLKAGQLAELEEGGDIADSAVELELGVTGLVINTIRRMPPLQTGDATLRINGRRMAFDVPDSWIVLPSGKRVMLGAGRLTVDDLRPDPEIARMEFQSRGSAQAILELLDHEPLGYVRAAGLKTSDLGGKTSGSFKLEFPLFNDLEFKHIKLRGTVDLEDATVKGAFGGVNVEGGELTFNVTEQALEARGDILVNGVPVVLSWQRIFDAPPDKQPELRLSTVLDEAARERLGLKLNHMIRGAVPVIMSIAQMPSAGKRRKVRVQADLGGAELILANMGWRKPRGRAAVLNFDIGQGVEGNTELQNFRIIGDDIAIDGWISLDEDQRPKAFYFPDFSFNVITQLEVSGKLRNDNVWEVQAHGPAYDGRQFFRSLFSSGQLSEDENSGPESVAGIELNARIGTMVGFFDTMVKDVSIDLVKQPGGRLVALDARGRLNGKEDIVVKLVEGGQNERVVLAESNDAGSAFRLIGFYPRMEGGRASLKVSLDALGLADKTGTLWAKDFSILGDRVVSEVISNVSDDPAITFGSPAGGVRVGRRQRIPFHQLEVKFSVGGGRFVLQDAYVNGPLLGATLRGHVDIKNNQVDLSGTYIPLYGLNSALGSIPLIGSLLVGRRGEGVLGITFSVKGPAADPRVSVNPISLVAPGIFRQMFEYTSPAADAYQQTPQQPANPEPSVSPFDPEIFSTAN